MGLFVLKENDTTLAKAKAALANLKLDCKLMQPSYLVQDFAMPYLEEVVKELEDLELKNKELNPAISELVKLGDGVGGARITGTKEEIHEVLKQAFDVSKSKSFKLEERYPEFAKLLSDNLLELF